MRPQGAHLRVLCPAVALFCCVLHQPEVFFGDLLLSEDLGPLGPEWGWGASSAWRAVPLSSLCWVLRSRGPWPDAVSCLLLPGLLLRSCGDSGDCRASPAGLAGSLCSKPWPHSCHWCQCQGPTPDGLCRWGWARPPGPAFQDQPQASTGWMWLQGLRPLMRVSEQLHRVQKWPRLCPLYHHWLCALKSSLCFTCGVCSSVLIDGASVSPGSCPVCPCWYLNEP